MGAVRERVTVSPVTRKEDLSRAFMARGYVGRDQLITCVLKAFSDLKGDVAGGVRSCNLDPFDVREGRGIIDKAVKKPADRLADPFDLYLDAAACVEDPAGEVVFVG